MSSTRFEERQAGWAYSLRDLGRQVGRSHTAVRYWTERADWPFGRPVRWPLQVAAVEDWATESLETPPEESAEVKRLRGLKLAAEIERLRMLNAELRGEMVDRRAAERAVLTLIHGLRSALLGFGSSIADKLHAEGLLRDGHRQAVQRLTEAGVDDLLHSLAELPVTGPPPA